MNELIERARKLTNRLTTRMDINPRHAVEIRLLIKELTDAIAQQEVGQAFPPSTWECPICKKLMVMKDLNWCGKNLQCKNCESFSYYSDWVMIECKPEASKKAVEEAFELRHGRKPLEHDQPFDFFLTGYEAASKALAQPEVKR